MKILITGVNAVQCGHRPKLDYASAFLSVRWACQQFAEVDARPVTVGEDLSQYDKIILYLAPIRGFVGVHAPGAMWAYAMYHDKVVLSFDDWQIREIMVSFQATLATYDKTIDDHKFGWKGIDLIKSDLKEEYRQIVEHFSRWDLKEPMLVPYYPGGDLNLLHLPGKDVHQFNPAAYFRGRYGELQEAGLKKKQWILAALHDHQSWLKKQKLQWPVLQFGAKKLGQPRLKESELFQHYADSWGVLSPKYYTCGSGWWRARHGFSADALCIVAGAPEELAMLGNEYTLSPQEIESLSDSDLSALAQEQRAKFNYEGTAEMVQAIQRVVTGT
jgi:hypothetical protein